MKAFAYATAHSTDSARELVADHGAYLAGGNDLLGLLKDYLIPGPNILVNVKSLPGLNRIERGDKSWTIGALVTVAEIENDAEVAKVFPGLHDAAAEIASPQIRNVATVGGNLAQHSRCWYFRQRDVRCLKKGGDLCYARDGENRYHSLFTGNDCISPVVSSLATTFAALDATAIVLRDGKETRLSMAELYQKAWTEPTAHNSLAPGDLILRVEIPTARTPQRVSASQRQAHIRLGAGELRGGGERGRRKIKPAARRARQHLTRAAPGRGRQRFSRRQNAGRRDRVAGGGPDFEGRQAAGTQRLQDADGARAHPAHAAQTERLTP